MTDVMTRYNVRSRHTGKWLSQLTWLKGFWYWRASRTKATRAVKILEFWGGSVFDGLLLGHPGYEAVPIEKAALLKPQSPEAWT